MARENNKYTENATLIDSDDLYAGVVLLTGIGLNVATKEKKYKSRGVSRENVRFQYCMNLPEMDIRFLSYLEKCGKQ